MVILGASLGQPSPGSSRLVCICLVDMWICGAWCSRNRGAAPQYRRGPVCSTLIQLAVSTAGQWSRSVADAKNQPRHVLQQQPSVKQTCTLPHDCMEALHPVDRTSNRVCPREKSMRAHLYAEDWRAGTRRVLDAALGCCCFP